ncbi:MAG: hypothetical protein R6X12_01105 [bacterium]
MITAPGLALALLLTAAPGGLVVCYEIDCALDESARAVAGRQSVVVRNDAGEPLTGLWFHLHPRAFGGRNTTLARELASMKNFELAWAEPPELGDLSIDGLLVDGRAPAETLLHETELEVRLAAPLQPGDSVRVEFSFTTILPGFFLPGLGRRGRFVFLDHWHPQLAAWRGRWHIEGVHPAGLAPAQVADYDVSLTLPGDLAVAATGRQVEPDPDAELARLAWPPGTGPRRDASPRRHRFRSRQVAGFALALSPDLVVERVTASGVAVDVFTRERNRGAWRDVPGQAAAIVEAYSGWYGPPPLDRIAVVDATGILPADASAPGLVLLSQRPLPLTRLAERALARRLAFQWFAPAGAPDPLGSSWLVAGPAVFSQVRYLEERYGPSNLLDLPFAGPLAGLGDDWYNRLLYYLAASNRALGSLAEPRFDYTTNPLSYSDSRYAQAGGFCQMLQRRVGAPGFDRALRAWVGRADRSAAPESTLIAACSDAAGRDLDWLFDRWLPAVEPCDYALVGARRRGDEHRVGIRRVGGITMPVELELAFADGTRVRRDWSGESAAGAVAVSHPARLSSVTLDPDRRLFEIDRWNNHWPRRVTIDPVFALPSFEAYQLFYGPYPWYDDYHGLQLGAWLQGRQFIESGPLRGRHAWGASLSRAFRLNDWQTSVDYATPLPVLSERLRFLGIARYSPRIATVECQLEQGLSPVLRQDGATIQLRWLLTALTDTVARDPRAWERARTAELKLAFLHTTESRQLKQTGAVGLGWGSRALGGEYDFGRASVEQFAALRFGRTRAVSVRLFAGGVAGSVPLQNRVYLSGGLVATPSEPATWAYQGPASGQENWHYTADVNCRGWAGEYLAGRWGWGANFHLGLVPFVQPFLDVGNVADSPLAPGLLRPRVDAGVRFKLSWLYADFPVWRWEPGTDGEFIFKWMIGLNLAGLGDF